MTTYTDAADVVPGDLDGLDLAVGTLSKAADRAAGLSSDLGTAIGSTEDFWTSPSGTAYRISAQKQVGAVGMLVGPLDTASQAFGTLARELRGARSTVDRALADSVALGMGPADLVGDPWAVVSFLTRNPQHTFTVAGMLSDIAGARVAAGSAHTAFVESLTGVRDGLEGVDERLLGSRRDPDERGGRRIVGYQYLHGTDRDVGDFEFTGTSNVHPRGDGTYDVTVDGGYTWNDLIDPNPKYSTDRWKSRLAEVLTLGQADPYDIHITWHAPTKLVLDGNGRVISASGYPHD